MNQNGKKRGIHRNVQLRATFMAAAGNWQNYLVAPAGAPVHQVSGQNIWSIFFTFVEGLKLEETFLPPPHDKNIFNCSFHSELSYFDIFLLLVRVFFGESSPPKKLEEQN